jgi:hypothetical protein
MPDQSLFGMQLARNLNVDLEPGTVKARYLVTSVDHNGEILLQIDARASMSAIDCRLQHCRNGRDAPPMSRKRVTRYFGCRVFAAADRKSNRRIGKINQHQWIRLDPLGWPATPLASKLKDHMGLRRTGGIEARRARARVFGLNGGPLIPV